MIRPLGRRRHHSLTRKRIVDAAILIATAADRRDRLREVAQRFRAQRTNRARDAWKDPGAAAEFIALSCALYDARRISIAEHVFNVGSTIEGVHEGRWLDGDYQDDLGPISDALDALEADNWDEEEDARLNERYSQLLDQKLLATFEELSPDDMLVLFRDHADRYDLLRERGRRHFHHRDEFSAALRDLVAEGFSEARTAAAGGAYRSAVTLLAASLEGLLLLRCLASQVRAKRIAQSLPRKHRPAPTRDMSTWTFDTLIEVCDRAGWLPQIASDAGTYSSTDMAQSLRHMRNWIHPARAARERAWLGVYREDYELADALYTLVATAVKRPRSVPYRP